MEKYLAVLLLFIVGYVLYKIIKKLQILFFSKKKSKSSKKTQSNTKKKKSSNNYKTEAEDPLSDDIPHEILTKMGKEKEETGTISDESVDSLLDAMGYVSPIPTKDGFKEFLKDKGTKESMQLLDDLDSIEQKSKENNATEISSFDDVAEYLAKNPFSISYYAWLKEEKKHDKTRKDGLSINLENKFLLRELCLKSISFDDEDKEDSIIQFAYFQHLNNAYLKEDIEKKHQIFLNKQEKENITDDEGYMIGNKYHARIIKRLSTYNKLAFVYTLNSLISAKAYLDEEGKPVIDGACGVFGPFQFLMELLVKEGLFKGQKDMQFLSIVHLQMKLLQKKNIVDAFADKTDRDKDAIIFLLLNLVFRKKEPRNALSEYENLLRFIDNDSSRVKFDDNGRLSEDFFSEDDAVEVLLNKDDEFKRIFQVMVEMIISSNLHYSVKEQYYYGELIKKAKLHNLWNEVDIHEWILSYCDSDQEEFKDDLTAMIKKAREKRLEITKKIENEKDLKKQEKLLKSAIKEYPDHYEFQNLYTYNLYDQKKYKEGIQVIKKAIDKNPEKPNYYDTCGIGYYYLEDYEKALNHLNKAIALDPKGEINNINENFYNRGNVFTKMGKIKEAKKDFKEALNFNYPYFKKYAPSSVKNKLKKKIENALKQL